MFFVYKSARDYLKTSWYVLGFAAAALFVCIASQKWGVFNSLDHTFALWLNTLIGRSYAYDRLLALLNGPRMKLIAAGIIFAIYVVYAWQERYWDMGRLLGYLLWIGAGVAIASYLAYLLTEHLELQLHIHGPHFTLRGMTFHGQSFVDISHKHPHWNIETRDRDSMPARDTTVYFAIFWLAFFRSRRLAWWLLAPALILSPAGMLVGREWPSSVLAGILWAGAVGAFLTRTPLAVVPQWIEEKAIVLVERVLTFWTPSLPRKTAAERMVVKTVDIPAGPQVFIKYVTEDRRDHLASLIQDHILPLLNCAPKSEILISDVPPDGNDDGAHPSRWVRFVTGGGLERGIVVKAAWKNPFNTTQKQRFAQRRNAANMHALLEVRGIPVPRLIFTHSTRRVFAPRRFFFTVEDLLHERMLRQGSIEDCVAAARQLAQMHRIERNEAGGLFGLQVPRSRYPHRVVLPRVRHVYSTIIRELPMAELSFFSHHTMDWFWERSAAVIESGCNFALCHGEIGQDNVRFTDEGVKLLGFTRTAFDLPGFDLVRALAKWGGGNSEAMAATAEAYFAAAAPEEWPRFSDPFELYLAMTMFELLHEHLHLPEEERKNDWLRKTADYTAKVLRGAAGKPATPKDAAESVRRALFL